MSLQAVQRMKTEFEKTRTAKQNARQEARRQSLYNQKVQAVSEEVVTALTRGRNHGVVYADSEELLLLIIAVEIGLVEEMADLQSAHRHARQIDSATGYKKHQQGDRQRLMRDAVNLALRNGTICKHLDSDSNSVALYLPQNRPPKWTAFFADSQKGIADYMPTKRELAITLIVNNYAASHEEETVPLTSHDLALLRAWGEQFAF